MKKLNAIIIVLIMVISLSACTKEKEKDEPKPVPPKDKDIMCIGQLYMCGVDEKKYNDKIHEINVDTNKNRKDNFVFLNTFDDITKALKAAMVDKVVVSEDVAKYLKLIDENIEIGSMDFDIDINFGMMMMKDNKKLCDKISKIIVDMKNDGTLNDLKKRYIDSVIDGEKYKKVDLAHIKGGKKVTIAVTGDLPPMDYINYDGEVVGYNLALIAELGKRGKINFDIKKIDSSDRKQILFDKKADVVFWGCKEKSDVLDNEWQPDIMKDVVCTDSYYGSKYCMISYAQ